MTDKEQIIINGVDVRIFADGTVLRYDSLDAILDIINKLKGGNDE